MGGGENDENRQMFTSKFSEILDEFENPKPKESADDIRERMINKSRMLTGDNNECI